MEDVKHIYIMVDTKQPGWIKLGEAVDVKARLSSYNTGSRGRTCSYHDTWDVPASMRDTDLHAELRAISEEQDHEWFRVDADDAASLIDEIVDRAWDERDPDHAMHTIDEYMIDDIHGDDWAKVGIGMMTPAACDKVLSMWIDSTTA